MKGTTSAEFTETAAESKLFRAELPYDGVGPEDLPPCAWTASVEVLDLEDAPYHNPFALRLKDMEGLAGCKIRLDDTDYDLSDTRQDGWRYVLGMAQDKNAIGVFYRDDASPDDRMLLLPASVAGSAALREHIADLRRALEDGTLRGRIDERYLSRMDVSAGSN